MQAHGLPMLPHGHPVLDGKVKRFGPGKKSWYALREVSLTSGEIKVSGAFGVWQGTNNNAILVTMDWNGVSDEERADAERKQREHDAREVEKKARLGEFAANRARMQWNAAATDDVRISPYLERKQVRAEGVRITEDGTVLVPMRKYALDGAKLVGLQKISPDGTKLFNKGMDKVGAGCLLGTLSQDTPLAIVGEGYATCSSVRMAFDVPVMVAFDAGNLLAVAKVLRRDFPATHLLFAADDDSQLESRLHERLLKEFGITGVLVDGGSRSFKVADAVLSVTAAWRMDVNGVPFIEVDVRGGRVLRTLRFENAGLASAKAAAAAVGNASVAYPQFPDLKHYQAGDCDFNDLHLSVSLDAVRLQIGEFIAVASSNPLIDATVESPAPSDQGALPPNLSLAHSGAGIPRTPLSADASSPLMEVKAGSIESLLRHFSLVYGKTDVWDALNQQVIKKAAFAACFGAKLAKEWLEHPERKTKDQKDLPMLKGGRALEGGGAGGDPLKALHQRYVLLYGTETVWDRAARKVLNLSALRAAHPDLAGRWLDSSHREMVDAENLVFDPTDQASPETHINMFAGFPLIPKRNDALVEPVLDLLASLCSTERNADEVFVWLLRWLAYPLQHPGAKMQTAVLMFGEKQGTGKSLFFEGVMRPIYGEYGTTAGQHQLESNFTDWKSRKIFVLFEEVLSRDERYSHLGTLKHMITGRDQRINPKGLPERVEANHLNGVFLSNESQPIPIDLEDRRFLVIEAKAKLAKEFYDQFKALLKAGASAAFYDFLLSYPLDGFNEHTKPLDTDAKDRIIKFGLPGWHVFHERWRDGEIDAPYCSCLSEDLYAVYSRWCEKVHERRLSLTKFAELMSGRVPKSRQQVSLGVEAKKQRTVFTIDSTDKESLSVQCQRFRKMADLI